MKFVQTPKDRFENLEGYPFAENYLPTKKGMQVHYVDEGKENEHTVLMLHGEPSWSYLYRKMIPVFVENGYRAIAPDLIGFGKSDKPVNTEDYSFENHLEWLYPVLDKLELKNVSLFLQDWGGLLGLRLLEKYDAVIDRIILANTFLPTGQVAGNKAFLEWRNFTIKTPNFNIGRIIQGATQTELSKEVIEAYNAPFPEEIFKAGARIFPSLVPMEANDPECIKNKEVWKFLETYKKPVLTLFADKDPIMKNCEMIFQGLVPGCKGQAHEIIPNTGHFIQEDEGELLAEKTVAFIKKCIA